MKKALSTIFVLAIGFALGQLTHLTSVSAQGGGAGQGSCEEDPTLYSVDVDGDDQLNVTDAVASLRWLFSDGPAPKVCLAPSDDPSGLPDTGQTRCSPSCGDTTCPGQDSFYQTGCPNEGRFVDNRDGTVTDTCTGLMWQKDTGNAGNPLNWCSSLAYCKDLELAGHDDWRLPNVRELQSIVDYGREEPAIDPVFSAFSTWYWSSTATAAVPGIAWYVGFDDGYVFVWSERLDSLVRAVRTAR